MDDQAAEQIEATLRARVQSQVPTPGSEAAVRALFAGLLAGKPNYDQMGPELAEGTRTQLARLEAGAHHYGAIQSMDFRGVGNMGEDVLRGASTSTAFRDGGLRYHRMARCSPRSSARDPESALRIVRRSSPDSPPMSNRRVAIQDAPV